MEIFQWPIRRFLILSPRILLVAAVPTGLFKCKLQCKPCQMNKSARCLHSRVLVNTRNTERDISQPRKSSSEKLIWYETWDEMTLNLFFPMYAQFCLGRLEFGRFGWNMKINAGEYVVPFSHHFTSFPRNLCGTYIASFKFIQIPQIKATNMSHSKFHNSERRECTGQCK